MEPERITVVGGGADPFLRNHVGDTYTLRDSATRPGAVDLLNTMGATAQVWSADTLRSRLSAGLVKPYQPVNLQPRVGKIRRSGD